MELGLDCFLGNRGMTIGGWEIPYRRVDETDQGLSETRGGVKFCQVLLEFFFRERASCRAEMEGQWSTCLVVSLG